MMKKFGRKALALIINSRSWSINGAYRMWQIKERRQEG